jgi:hypothetical protein
MTVDCIVPSTCVRIVIKRFLYGGAFYLAVYNVFSVNFDYFLGGLVGDRRDATN